MLSARKSSRMTAPVVNLVDAAQAAQSRVEWPVRYDPGDRRRWPLPGDERAPNWGIHGRENEVPQTIRAVLAGLVAALVLTGGALAQDATPSPGGGVCTVEPYDLATVLQPGDGTPVAEASPAASVERPTGEPAGEDVVAGVTETINQFVACINEGFQFRVLFLFTPEYLQQFITEQAGQLTAEAIQQLAEFALGEESTGVLPEDERTVIASIEDVEVLDDGRVVATVIGDDLSQPEEASPIYFIFEEVDGRYLIDGVIDPSPEATPAA